MARKRIDGRFTVSGPFVEPTPAVDISHGLSIAQNYATARLELEGEYEYLVSDLTGNVHMRVVKLEGERAVETLPA